LPAIFIGNKNVIFSKQWAIALTLFGLIFSATGHAQGPAQPQIGEKTPIIDYQTRFLPMSPINCPT